MTRETLYDLAFRYKKTKLWKQMYDSQIFAARTENNETIFICIMGILGEHIAVAVYPAKEFYSYYKFLDMEPELFGRLTPAAFEEYIRSSCIQCSFENKDMLHPSELEEAKAYARSHGISIRGSNAYPQFTRFLPYHLPWHVRDEHDLDLLAAGLEASISLSGILQKDPGFAEKLRHIHEGQVQEVPILAFGPQGYVPDGTVPLPGRQADSFPRGTFDNEVVLQKIRKKKQGGNLDCRVTWMNNTIQENDDVIPYYPAALMAVEESEGTVLSLSVTGSYDTGYNELLSQFMETLAQRKKRPSKVLVQSERTFALLEDTMKKISADLELKADLPCLDNALYSMQESISEGSGNSPEDAGDRAPTEADLSRMLDEIESMDDALLLFIPDELTSVLDFLAKDPAVSSALQKRLESLLQKIDRVRQNGPAKTRRESNDAKKPARRNGKKKKQAEAPLSYVISVSPCTGCYRHIRVSADITLDGLHEIIQDVFGFYNDHLYAFFMDNRAWSGRDAYFCPGDGEGRLTSDYSLRDLSLYKGMKFLYLFDYGDEWRFACRVLRTVDEATEGCLVLRSKGEAPDQYPDYDDEDDDEDTDW